MLNKRLSRAAALMITLVLMLAAMPLALADDPTPVPAPAATLVIGEDPDIYAPIINAGGTLAEFVIPISARGGDVSEVECELVISTELDRFPFVVEKQEYRERPAGGGDIPDGHTDKVTFANLKVNGLVTAGLKEISLKVTYKYTVSGLLETGEVVLPVYVRVGNGYVETTPKPSTGGSYTASTPKINFDSFIIEPSELYPGDAFSLTLVLQNTSTKQSVRNIIVTFSDATATILPAGTGSNSQFIDKIDKDGGTAELRFELQIAASAEARACQLDVKVDYEGGSSSARGPYTVNANITVPIKQRIRVKYDKPSIYDEAWAGQPFNVQQQMYNLSRATIYNCIVTVEGEGLTMDGDSYFGGNVAAGGTMRADFDVTSENAGDVKGEIIIRFEDANFDQHEERVPLSVYVNDPNTAMPFTTPGDAMPEEPVKAPVAALFGIPWYFAAGGGAVLAAAVAFWIVAAKKKRARELEEL